MISFPQIPAFDDGAEALPSLLDWLFVVLSFFLDIAAFAAAFANLFSH